MAPRQTIFTCLGDKWSDYYYGKITEEARLRNVLTHIFDGTRHAGEGGAATEYSDHDLTSLASEDLVGATVAMCMRDDDQYRVPLDLQPKLMFELLRIRDATLDDLRRSDEGTPESGVSRLLTPPISQIIIAAAFQAGNRDLVQSMIANTPPPKGIQLLYSGACSRFAEFSGVRGHGHGALRGQRDNACGLFAQLIQAKWSVPDEDMQPWIPASGSLEEGKALLSSLAQHGVPISHWTWANALSRKKLDLAEAILQAPTAQFDEHAQFDMLRMAITSLNTSQERLACLESLWRNNIRALNWRLTKMPLGIRGREDINWDRTALHEAVHADDVEVVTWLVQRGAKSLRDQYDKSPFDYAKEKDRKEILDVFEKQPECVKHNLPEYSCGVPQVQAHKV